MVNNGSVASKIIEMGMNTAASKTTAGERLTAMRAKMGECGVDGARERGPRLSPVDPRIE